MKVSMIALSLMISTQALSMNLSYQEHVKVLPLKNTAALPGEFLRLHRNLFYDDQRMIAGSFDTSRAKKSSYWDKLRVKLQGQKVFPTF